MTYEILRFSEKPVIESSQPFRESPLYTLNKQYITIYMWGPYNTIVLKQWAHIGEIGTRSTSSRDKIICLYMYMYADQAASLLAYSSSIA